MGKSDEDIKSGLRSRPKQVSVQAFFMDETAITNNEYRQFVHWVRDSIAKTILGGEHVTEIDDGVEIEERLNWDVEIDWSDPDVQMMLDEIYYDDEDRLETHRAIDVRELEYQHQWTDLNEAARGQYIGDDETPRTEFQRENEVEVYPDTLVWVRDFTYSYNEPMTRQYFWHPSYDDYPVVGVNWDQARAFSAWRTDYLNSYYKSIGEPIIEDFRLPTEAEWEYAARGGRDHSPYPWGGPYIRNHRGCFLANFKPLRGNYAADGGFYPVEVYSYFPNDYGLYQMSGNVAEWTKSTYEESKYQFMDDLNPHMDFEPEKEEDAPETRKRRVTRGGSWKDIGYYLQNGTRAYEFQDTTKSYVGFRNVMTFMGRDIADQ